MADCVLTVLAHVTSRLRAEVGQGTTEYALILCLIALVAITALHFLGGSVTTELSTISRSVSAAAS